MGGTDAPSGSPGGCTNLFQAVMRSDTAALEELLAETSASVINRPNAAGLTPLMLAIERDRPISRQFLEEHGAAHLYARFDNELVQRITSRPAEPMTPAVRLQVLELELRHPEQRQSSLRRLLSYSGDTVEQVSRTVDSHTETCSCDAQAENLDHGAAASAAGLRCVAPKRSRVRLQGTGVSEGLDMIDTQELLDELDALADPQAHAAVQAGGTDNAKHEHVVSRRASVCKYGDSCWTRLAEPEPEPEPELPFDEWWFPEAEEPDSVVPARLRAHTVAGSETTASSESSSEEQNEQDDDERERPVGRTSSAPVLRSAATAKAKTTAAGKMKNYSSVQSRVDARLRRSKGDASATYTSNEPQQTFRCHPRLTLSFGDTGPVAEKRWYPSAADATTTDKLAFVPHGANPNVSAAAFEHTAGRRARPGSADSIAMMSILRTASDLSGQRRMVTPPPTPARRTGSPVASEPTSPTTTAQGVSEIIGESVVRDKSPPETRGARTSHKQQQQRSLEDKQRRPLYEELVGECFLTDLLLKQRRREADQRTKQSPGLQQQQQQQQRQQHLRDHQQLDNHRRKQRDKTMAAALPKKSSRSLRRNHGIQQQKFRPTQTWSGTMLAW